MALYITSKRASNTTGFSLTELIIAAVMLLVVLGSLASIFESTNRQTAATDRRYRQESNIDADLALVTKLNEHYTCANPTDCVSSIGTHPTKNGYFPLATDTEAINAFNTLCATISGTGSLTEDLITLVEATESELPGIRKLVEQDTRAHRYTVTYSSDPGGELLRQASFVPTAANWCPEIP